TFWKDIPNSSGSFHSYINQPITDIDTISYVSSIVFLQLRGYKKLDLHTAMIKMGINGINFW
ncbi:13087_t:CDS:2, partial [Entrophospora sp. SA101]